MAVVLHGSGGCTVGVDLVALAHILETNFVTCTVSWW